MERKIAFSIGLDEGVWLRHDRIARHVETLPNGFAVVVDSNGTFEWHRDPHARLRFVITAYHYGQKVAEVNSGTLVQPLTKVAKAYATRHTLSVDNLFICVGFAGKGVSRGKAGWLPKYLYVKLEPAE